MVPVILTDNEINQIVSAIEVSTAFYEACKKKHNFAPVVDIFDDAIAFRKSLLNKLIAFRQMTQIQCNSNQMRCEIMPKKIIYEIDAWGVKTPAHLYAVQYTQSGTLAIVARTTCGEPFAVLTVNLSSLRLTTYQSFVDTNNCPWAEKFLVENNIAKPVPHVSRRSGFCSYPLYSFNPTLIDNDFTEVS